MTRSQIITARLREHLCGELGTNIANPEPEYWWDNLTSLGPWAILGFGMPVKHPSGTGEYIVPFCPEVIEQTCEDYDDAVFDEWIELVQAIIGLYLAHMDIEDPDERHDLVAMELGAMSEVALEEVQIQIEVADFRFLQSQAG